MAGVVALVATGVGALGVAGAGIAGIGTFASIARVASAVAMVASVGAQAIGGQKKPPAIGNTSQVFIGANMPQPYSVGRTYVGGHLVHDVGYGSTIKDVPNPYRSLVLVWSGAGPVEQIESIQADFQPVGSRYNGFLWTATQRGLTPEPSALAGPHGAIPGWGAGHKLSGYAAGIITAKFDKDGKVFASGLPQFGAIGRWVWAYDPRKDSTYPGGVGAHRWEDELSWSWTDNPALHALTYARGRFHNGKKVMGCGFKRDSIDVAAYVAFANVCDANGWTVGGTVYEPGSRWDNLKRFCAAGAGRPGWVGARQSVRFSAPKVALDALTPDDLADGDYSAQGMKSWRDRVNGIVPKYRSEAHKWEYVQGAKVSVASYVAQDGEEKTEERQYDLVQSPGQAAQLAAYDLVNAREIGPIVLHCKPRMIEYRPGDALEVDVPELGLDNRLCVITDRAIDPATAIITLTLETEDSTKHAFALGRTDVAPPTPALMPGDEVDLIVATPQVQRGLYSASETYYRGDIVDTAGGARWEYIALRPSTGRAPPATGSENAYWRQVRPQISANEIPAAPGFTVGNVLAQLQSQDSAHSQGLANLDQAVANLNNSVSTIWSVLGGSDAQGFRARVVNLETTTVANDNAQAQRISALEASNGNVTARLGTLEQTVATNDNAQASRLTALESEITNARNGYGSLSARIGTFEQATVDALAGKASASTVTTLVSEVQDARAGYGSLSARIGTFSGTIADALNGKASAQSVSDLQVTVGGLTGRISTVESVTADISGKVNASVSLVLDAGGRVAGYRIQANNTTVSTFDVLADVFRFSSNNGTVTPFSVSSGGMDLNVPLRLYYPSGNIAAVLDPT